MNDGTGKELELRLRKLYGSHGVADANIVLHEMMRYVITCDYLSTTLDKSFDMYKEDVTK